VTAPARYPVRTRILHWLTALLIFSMLFIGFVMVNSVGSYSTLRAVHMTLGITVLVIVVARIANRFTHRAPKLPGTVGWFEHKLVLGSELSLYALMFAQPLIGWAMVSAGGQPVVIFGSIRLPRLAPFDANLFFILRQTHSLVAYLLVAIIAAHVSAVLLHTLTLRDGMLSRMTFGRRHVAQADDSADSGTEDSADMQSSLDERTNTAYIGRHRGAGSN
jgi:cytochrome b561